MGVRLAPTGNVYWFRNIISSLYKDRRHNATGSSCNTAPMFFSPMSHVGANADNQAYFSGLSGLIPESLAILRRLNKTTNDHVLYLGRIETQVEAVVMENITALIRVAPGPVIWVVTIFGIST